jgi:hypothetical protein
MSEKALAWIVGNDTGMSSKALWAVMMGQKSDRSHPHDPADLGRCLRLLEAVPEWKPRLSEMAAVSNYWAALVANWAELERLMREETGMKRDWQGKATKTYDKMKAILRPLEDADRHVFRMGDGVTMRFGA